MHASAPSFHSLVVVNAGAALFGVHASLVGPGSAEARTDCAQRLTAARCAGRKRVLARARSVPSRGPAERQRHGRALCTRPGADLDRLRRPTVARPFRGLARARLALGRWRDEFVEEAELLVRHVFGAVLRESVRFGETDRHRNLAPVTSAAARHGHAFAHHAGVPGLRRGAGVEAVRVTGVRVGSRVGKQRATFFARERRFRITLEYLGVGRCRTAPPGTRGTARTTNSFASLRTPNRQ